MSDFSVHIAGEILNLMTQGTVRTPPSNVFVAVIDNTGTERSTDFQNNRASTSAGSDWTVTDTEVENENEISFGEATTDVNGLVDVALFDSASGGNKLAQYTMDSTPFDVATGTTLTFPAGDLSFDVIDETE
ncbi:hypothetical protein 7841G1D8_28 [Haloquadratum phage sp.]|nr:hypothetical protein 7841G1D8_28 [Haloquadratum phage sp.]